MPTGAGQIHRRRRGEGNKVKRSHSILSAYGLHLAMPVQLHTAGKAPECSAAGECYSNNTKEPFFIIIIIIHSFYIALFSALEQTQCAHVACDCE